MKGASDKSDRAAAASQSNPSVSSIASIPSAGRFLLKSWRVAVQGYGSGIYEAPSRGKALSMAWNCDAFCNVSFKDFLRMASCWCEAPTVPDFGAPITVGGKPAFFVSSNRAYVRFVRPDSTVISSAHPYDVEPVEFRPAQYRPSPVNTEAA